MLDAGAYKITGRTMIVAAQAIADSVHPTKLYPNYILPSVFDPNVAPRGRRRHQQLTVDHRAGPLRAP